MKEAVAKLRDTTILRILVDAGQMERGNAAGRKRAREIFERHQNAHMAVFGANSFVMVILKFFLIIQGARKRMGIFETEKEAREWLKSCKPEG